MNHSEANYYIFSISRHYFIEFTFVANCLNHESDVIGLVRVARDNIIKQSLGRLLSVSVVRPRRRFLSVIVWEIAHKVPGGS